MRWTTSRTVEPMPKSDVAAACAFWLDVDRAIGGLGDRPRARRDEVDAVLRAFEGRFTL